MIYPYQDANSLCDLGGTLPALLWPLSSYSPVPPPGSPFCSATASNPARSFPGSQPSSRKQQLSSSHLAVCPPEVLVLLCSGSTLADTQGTGVTTQLGDTCLTFLFSNGANIDLLNKEGFSHSTVRHNSQCHCQTNPSYHK